jgi:dihydroorotate dehydrogenase electron transfer subunit
MNVQTEYKTQSESCRVVGQAEEMTGHFRLRLKSERIAAAARAGNFAHVLTHENSFDPLLRRAFSIMRAEGNEFEIFYRIQGRGTALLSRKCAGEVVDVLAPLGRAFSLFEGPAVLVGGGVGVPPLVMMAAQELREGRATVGTLRVLAGARSAREVIGRSDFATMGLVLEVVTDDGSEGEKGLVTAPLQRLLMEQSAKAEPQPTVYACGPLPMLRAVAKVCARFEASCQVSLEENMPCGIGVCNGCVVRVLGADEEYGRYRRVCVDGPAMWAHEIDWNGNE